MEWFEISWWMWLLLGVVLAAFEILTPGGVFIIFFGVGAAVVGLLDLVGVSMGFPVQGLVFVAISIVSLMLFRQPLLKRLNLNQPHGKVDDMVGETAQALEEIAADAIGKAELRGASWNVHNVGDTPIPRSARCRVERIDGLTLQVRAASPHPKS